MPPWPRPAAPPQGVPLTATSGIFTGVVSHTLDFPPGDEDDLLFLALVNTDPFQATPAGWDFVYIGAIIPSEVDNAYFRLYWRFGRGGLDDVTLTFTFGGDDPDDVKGAWMIVAAPPLAMTTASDQPAAPTYTYDVNRTSPTVPASFVMFQHFTANAGFPRPSSAAWTLLGGAGNSADFAYGGRLNVVAFQSGVDPPATEWGEHWDDAGGTINPQGQIESWVYYEMWP